MTLAKSKYWYFIKSFIPVKAYEPLLSAFYKLRSITYYGSFLHCPICNNNFRSFINGHTCPRCGSAKRHRLFYLYLKNKTNFFTKNLNVLHFAPEHCFYKKFISLKNLNYISADLNSPRAMIKVDMTKIQFPDNYFDVVISSHVLEHIPNDFKAMQELVRVMKKDGWGVHQVPIEYSRKKTFEDPDVLTNKERLSVYGHIDHKRIYGRDYKNKLEKAGFIVVPDFFASSLSENEKRKYSIDADEIIYLCKK